VQLFKFFKSSHFLPRRPRGRIQSLTGLARPGVILSSTDSCSANPKLEATHPLKIAKVLRARMSEAGKKCPWGAPQPVDSAPSLSDVMSEQLADDLVTKEESRTKVQEREDEAFAKALQASLGGAAGGQQPPEQASSVQKDTETDCKDDLLIAQMLQMQFDNEHDSVIANEERAHNQNSKVSVSYQKYKVVPEHRIWQDSDDEDKDFAEYLAMDDRKRDWDYYESADKAAGQMPRCGYKKNSDGTITTKHDKETNHRSNGKRIMSMKMDLKTGDGGGLDMQLSNKVYNQLKKFAWKDDKRREGRIHDKEEKAVAEQAVDPQTKLLLFKMVNNGILENVNGVISTGKEAVILHADGGPGPDPHTLVGKRKAGWKEDEVELEPINIPKECVIKVFKTTLNEFKTREKYIKDDYRFRSRFSKQNPRKVIHMWAEKEMRNLVKMARHGIHVPEAVMLKKHVLLMSFIGSDGAPAPKLRDVDFSENYADLEIAYEQVVDMMTRLYKDCHLVHADLSEYNILWQDGQAWFIDVSQAVEPNHPCGLEFLYRDCTNVADFFRQRGLVGGKSPWRLFTDITELQLTADDEDCPKSEAEILARIMDFEKSEEILTLGCAARIGEADEPDDLEDDENLVYISGSSSGGKKSLKHYPFDYCWDKAQANKANPVPIPGHAKPKGGSRGGKSPKSPSTVMMGKSPKSPKSPKSGATLASLSSKELQELKEELVKSPDNCDGLGDTSFGSSTSKVKFKENTN